MIFFADENIPIDAVRILTIFEQTHTVRALEDYFAKGTKDVNWMRGIAAWNEPVTVLCGDGRILKNKVERSVLKECNLMFVHLASGWTNLGWSIYCWKIIKVWPEIVKNVMQASKPMVFEIKPTTLKIQSYGPLQNL